MEEQWHAFYSKEAEQNSIKEAAFCTKIRPRVITNMYKLKKSDELVESTAVFSVENNADFKDCPYYFKDKIYLGIVDKWMKVGKCI